MVISARGAKNLEPARFRQRVKAVFNSDETARLSLVKGRDGDFRFPPVPVRTHARRARYLRRPFPYRLLCP